MTDFQRRYEFTQQRLAIPLIERLQMFRVSLPVKRTFGTWAVTPYGVECLIDRYAIPFADVDDPDWREHMRGKWWVNIIEFSLALRAARKVKGKTHRPKGSKAPVSLSLRFEVLRRDKFKCQLCGKSAAECHVVLEVDHKTPRSLGGDNSLDNLWTLCFDCNRGKAAKELA